MQVIKDFSEKALNQIRWWAWGAAVLPITALAGIFFIWAIGLTDLLSIMMTMGATIMFGVAAAWWWWIIWIVSKILKKDRHVANELKVAAQELSTIKNLVKENFLRTDK